MDSEVLEVLKEIRDEAKATNARLDQTNARLETVESRLRFVEKRVKTGFADVSQKIETVAKKQLAAEMHIVTELMSVAALLRAGAARRREDQKTVRTLAKRISALEKRQR